MSYLKQVFIKWWAESKGTLLTLLIAFLTILFGGAGVAYEAGQRARPSPVPTLEPTRARVTASPSPTLTKVPTLTPTLPVTLTPAPPTPTGTPGAFDPCSHWHAWQVDLRYPSLGMFSYGFNPCESIALYGPEFEAYLISQNVDGLPRSSAMEEPNGWRWLRVRVAKDGTQETGVTPGEGCALFDNDPEPNPETRLCITNATVRVHLPGDATHAKKRNHSIVVWARVCDVSPDGTPKEPCGTVGAMGIEDWGVKHMPYKTAFCYDDLTPRHWATNALYPLDLIGQPPYVALQPARNGYAHQFVSTITFNPLVEDYYHTAAFPEFPNHLIRATYNLMDAKEVFASCNGEILPTGYDASAYILHALALPNLPEARPFYGFTDANGYVDPTCTEIGLTCNLLFIGATVPQGVPFLSYPVQMDGKDAEGSLTGVIIQEFNP